MAEPVNLAVLLSGSGRTLQNFLDRSRAGKLDARVRLVLSSRADAYGLERAKALDGVTRSDDDTLGPLLPQEAEEGLHGLTRAHSPQRLAAGFREVLREPLEALDEPGNHARVTDPSERPGRGGADGGVGIPQVPDQWLDGFCSADPAQRPGRLLPYLVVGIVESPDDVGDRDGAGPLLHRPQRPCYLARCLAASEHVDGEEGAEDLWSHEYRQEEPHGL